MRGHVPADSTLIRIAEVLEVSPGYLRGGYYLPGWLSEQDIMFFVDRRNVELLQMVREAAIRGVSPEDFKKLLEIIEKTTG